LEPIAMAALRTVRGGVGGTLRSGGLRLRAPNKPVYAPAGGRLVPPLELTNPDKLGLLQPSSGQPVDRFMLALE